LRRIPLDESEPMDLRVETYVSEHCGADHCAPRGGERDCLSGRCKVFRTFLIAECRRRTQALSISRSTKKAET
jgi:hypothetical protein